MLLGSYFLRFSTLRVKKKILFWSLPKCLFILTATSRSIFLNKNLQGSMNIQPLDYSKKINVQIKINLPEQFKIINL